MTYLYCRRCVQAQCVLLCVINFLFWLAEEANLASCLSTIFSLHLTILSENCFACNTACFLGHLPRHTILVPQATRTTVVEA